MGSPPSTREGIIGKVSKAGEKQWIRTIGISDYSVARSINLTEEGDLLVVGFYDENGGLTRDIFLSRISADGAHQWSTAFTSAEIKTPVTLSQAPTGGYVIVGSIESSPK